MPTANPDDDSTTPDFIEANLLGNAPAFRRALVALRRIAACDASTLLLGETGTGKELAARAIHYLSARRAFPFVAVNCGAIPEALVEAELFGHARGAFTDAKDARIGLIGQAKGGTLFLDEIEAMTQRAQVALLRFLQDFEFRPVGGSGVERADLRVVAASNVDLRAPSCGFRPDLLFRLGVLDVTMPPLRERPGDALLLAEAFARQFSRRYGQTLRPFADAARAFIQLHDWPGNVRELENHVHRAVVMSDAAELTIQAVERDRPPTPALAPVGEALLPKFGSAKAQAIAEFERAYLHEALRRSGGNVSLAARIAGKERSRLGKLVRKYGLERLDFAPRHVR